MLQDCRLLLCKWMKATSSREYRELREETSAKLLAKRGRPKIYKTEEERIEARRKQFRESKKKSRIRGQKK